MPLCNTTSAALLELAAIGNPDVHSYCNPEVSLWIQAFQRITNYAIAEQDVPFSNPPEDTVRWTTKKCVKAELPRAGDLVAGVYFVGQLGALDLPVISANVDELDIAMWTPAVGYALLERSRVIVGSQCMEDFGSEYMMMHDEVHKREGNRAGLAVGDYGRYLRSGATVGADSSPHRYDEDTFAAGLEYSTRAQNLYVHVPFHFSLHPGSALNMIGLNQHRVEIEFDLRGGNDLIIEGTLNRANGSFTSTGVAPVSTGGLLTDTKLRVLYVHLDTPERRHRAQQPATIMYIYPQSQEVLITAADAGSVREVRNYHGHPVIDWLFAYRATARTATESYKRWNEFGAYRAGKYFLNTNVGGDDDTAPLAPQEVFNAITDVQVDLNSHTRLCVKTDYLRRALPADRAARVPSRVVYNYPLALDPTDQCGPPGSLNLSRVDNITLKFTFRSVNASEGNDVPPTAAQQERIGGLNSEVIFANGAGGGEIVQAGSTEGKIFWYARTIGFYKQQGGLIGLLYTS